MRLYHALFFLAVFFSSALHAYELITIQAVSDTKRTFITRNGKRQGVSIGMTGTFTAEDASILAKAINVSGQFTQWEIINSSTILPFEKGAVVTWYPATEYLWALSPEKARQKYIKANTVTARDSWVFKGALTRAVSESVSGVQATETRRGGYLGEIYYEKGLTPTLTFDVGLRHEREVVNYTGFSFNTQRNVLITNLIYYFDAFKDLLNDGRLFVGGGFGYGHSRTTSAGVAQSGPVGILPTVKIGLSLPFSQEWEFIVDSAFESLQTKEAQSNGQEQTTTQTNIKAGFGLRRFL